MPIVRIDIQAGKSTAYKREILHAVRSAIVESLGVSHERVQQRIVETPAENIDSPDSPTDHLTVIEISMLPGRSAVLKQAMYGAIVAHLGEAPGIHQHDITVLVNDPSAECFAIGGVMQCTVAPAGDDEDDEVELLAPIAAVPTESAMQTAPAADAAAASEGDADLAEHE
ncbi:MAG: tautomerase family protein [Coriobacteriia bacterium]|nr:tautomerase family protein [Coriobacteriia bacterium]